MKTDKETLYKTNEKFTEEQLKALQYETHSIVTANAGSGKTKVFASRYVNLALGVTLDSNKNYVKGDTPPVDVRKIVAITFTDKAAGELYNKIAKEIDRRIVDSEGDILQLTRLRRNLVSANISTIHSFCSKLLKKFPMKASLNANFTPIDRRVSDELLEIAIEEVIREVLNGKSSLSKHEEDIKHAVRILGSKGQLVEALKDMMQKKSNIYDLAEFYQKERQEIANFLKDEFDSNVNKLFDGKIGMFYNALKTINDCVGENADEENPYHKSMALILEEFEGNIDSAEDVCRLVSKLVANGLTVGKSSKIQLRSQNYCKGLVECSEEIDFVNEFMNLVFSLNIPENRALIEENLAEFGRKMMCIFRLVNDRYEEKKKESSYLDFEDILLKAKDLIKNNEDVVNELKKQIDYIMIDEYQDTNQLQYDLFLPLLKELNEKLSRGNLFVVGDEKQSIYMFRNADLKIFNDTAQDIENASGKRIELPHSFRMAYNNCLFTNFVFERLLRIEKDNPINERFNEVKNTNLICGIGKSSFGKVEFLFANSAENVLEENLVAGRILSLMSEKPFQLMEEHEGKKVKSELTFKHFAILCRKKDSFALLEKAFVEHNIPYVIIGGRGFYDNLVIKDIYNYLAFLVNQNDDVALGGLLRSPFFSISDRLIFQISLDKGYSLWNKLRNYASRHEISTDEEIKDLTRIIKILEENIIISKRNNITFTLRKILKESTFIPVISSRQNGLQDLANVEKLVKIANNFSVDNFNTLYDFVCFLSDAMEKETDESQAAVNEDENAVKIMTVHQSKGLEFPAVFVFDCNERVIKETIKSRSITINRDMGILTKVQNGSFISGLEAAPICNLHSYIQRKREAAEAKRLLYVALTRAANYLGISSEYKVSSKEVKFSPENFIGMIEQAMPQKFGCYLMKKDSEILIKNDVTYLEQIPSQSEGANGGVVTKTDYNVGLSIPIIYSAEKKRFTTDTESPSQYKMNLSALTKYSETDEIITASKYAAFLEDPELYYARYILGFSDQNILHKEKELPKEERSLTYLASARGTLVHLLLSGNLKPSELNSNNLEAFIKQNLDFPIEKDKKAFDQLKKEVLTDLNTYFASSVYNNISAYQTFKNEFELWHFNDKHNYFMHGFIDKVILNGNNAIIIDYKTNVISNEESLLNLNDHYLPQLEFYAVLIKKRFPEIKTFSLQIIYVKDPDKSYIKEINESELSNVEDSITKTVLEIRKF